MKIYFVKAIGTINGQVITTTDKRKAEELIINKDFKLFNLYINADGSQFEICRNRGCWVANMQGRTPVIIIGANDQLSLWFGLARYHEEIRHFYYILNLKERNSNIWQVNPERGLQTYHEKYQHCA